MSSDMDLTAEELDKLKKSFKIPAKGKRLDRYLLRVKLDKEMVPFHRFNGAKPDYLWWKCRLIIQGLYDTRKVKDRVPGTIPRFQYEEEEFPSQVKAPAQAVDNYLHSKHYCPVCLKLRDLSTSLCPDCDIPLLRTWDYGEGYIIRGGK